MKNGSYFNEDQQDYMRYLATLPPEAKCACGWYRIYECPNCTPERGGKRLKAHAENV